MSKLRDFWTNTYLLNMYCIYLLRKSVEINLRKGIAFIVLLTVSPDC